MWQAFVAVFMALIVPLGVKLLKGLGFGFITFTGLDLLLDQLEQLIFTNFEALPAKVFQIAVMTGIDQYFVIVVSALTMAFAMQSFGGSVKSLKAGVTT
jgi:hypothetical protein